MSMVALGLSQFVLAHTHQTSHTLDLIFGAGIHVDSEAAKAVLWSNHFALKTQLHMLSPMLAHGY